MKKGSCFIIILSIVLIMISCSNEKSKNYGKVIAVEQGTQTPLKWHGQWFGEGKKETLIREIAREFSLLNQDVDLELKFSFEVAGIDSFADPFRPIADSIASWVRGNRWPYDIFLCDKWLYNDIATVLNDRNWGPKYLTDFKNEEWFIDAHKEYVLSNPEYLNGYGGIAPGAFIEGAWNLLYASSLVEETLGLKVKDYDMTIDDLIEYAKVVYNYNLNSNEKITFIAINYQNVELMINQILLSELGNIGSQSQTDQLNALLNVYKKLETLAKYQPVTQHHVYNTDRELKHDKALFHLHATWVIMFWQRSNPEGEKLMRPCEFPSMTGKTANTYSGIYNAIFVVPKNAKNKEAAIRLMKFMSSQDVADKWENYSKCPTGLQNRITMNEFGTDGFSLLSKHITQKYDNKLKDAGIDQIMFNGRQSHINYHAIDVIEGRMKANQAINSIRAQIR